MSIVLKLILPGVLLCRQSVGYTNTGHTFNRYFPVHSPVIGARNEWTAVPRNPVPAAKADACLRKSNVAGDPQALFLLLVPKPPPAKRRGLAKELRKQLLKPHNHSLYLQTRSRVNMVGRLHRGQKQAGPHTLKKHRYTHRSTHDAAPNQTCSSRGPSTVRPRVLLGSSVARSCSYESRLVLVNSSLQHRGETIG